MNKMTHEEIEKLAKEPRLLRLLEISLMRAARAVMMEGTTSLPPAGLTKRHNEAVKVVQDLKGERNKFSILIADTEAVNSLIQVENESFIWPEDMTALYTSIDNACAGNFNVVAGLYYDETQSQ
jgi:hypothetical protein